MITCIYHNRDLDGYSSAAIVKLRYPKANLVGYDYGQPIPWEHIPVGEPVIMVDVSLAMPDMERLGKYSNYQLTWIDHHISAMKDYEDYCLLFKYPKNRKFLTSVLNNKIAACEGTWEYLFPNKPIPEYIKLLGEYDTWRNSNKERWDNRILPFQFGLRICCNSPETFPDHLFTDNFCEDHIKVGVIVLAYQAKINETACKKSSFEIEFEGLRAICLNGGGFNSDVFKSVYDETKHDLMMPFQFNGKFWTVSMYTTKSEVDCSALAKKHGGGGHKNAAGFQVNSDRIKEIFFK